VEVLLLAPLDAPLFLLFFFVCVSLILRQSRSGAYLISVSFVALFMGIYISFFWF
jgi:hypothetical protein